MPAVCWKWSIRQGSQKATLSCLQIGERESGAGGFLKSSLTCPFPRGKLRASRRSRDYRVGKGCPGGGDNVMAVVWAAGTGSLVISLLGKSVGKSIFVCRFFASRFFVCRVSVCRASLWRVFVCRLFGCRSFGCRVFVCRDSLCRVFVRRLFVFRVSVCRVIVCRVLWLLSFWLSSF